MRKLIRLVVTAGVTGFLVWLPTVAQAGLNRYRRRLTCEDTHAARGTAGLSPARALCQHTVGRPSPNKSGEESVMRRFVRLVVTAAVTGFMVWLPIVAQAGLTATAAD